MLPLTYRFSSAFAKITSLILYLFTYTVVRKEAYFIDRGEITIGVNYQPPLQKQHKIKYIDQKTNSRESHTGKSD